MMTVVWGLMPASMSRVFTLMPSQRSVALHPSTQRIVATLGIVG